MEIRKSDTRGWWGRGFVSFLWGKRDFVLTPIDQVWRCLKVEKRWVSFCNGETVIRSTRVWVFSIETRGERKAYISFDISASSAWVTLRLRVTAWFWLSSFVLRVRVWRSRRECAIKHTDESFFSSLSSSSVTCREREKERERKRERKSYYVK